MGVHALAQRRRGRRHRANTQRTGEEVVTLWAPIRICSSSADVNVPVLRRSFSSDRRL
jgi:hypothetical protein